MNPVTFSVASVWKRMVAQKTRSRNAAVARGHVNLRSRLYRFLSKIRQFGASRSVSSRKAVGQATSHWLTLEG